MELLTTFSILSVSCILLVWLWLRDKYNFWKKRGIITPPYTIPFGNLTNTLLRRESFTELILGFYRFFKSQGQIHGGIYMTFQPAYMPIDLNIVKSILQVDFQHFTGRGVYVNEKADPLSSHLFSLEGKKWKILRSKLSPTFTSGKLRMMFETLVNCTAGLSKVIDIDMGEAVDIKELSARFTTDVIASCAFGLDCNSLENPDNEFRNKGRAIFKTDFVSNMTQLVFFFFPNIFKKFNIKILPRHIEDFFMGVVKDTVQYREENNISRRDFMHLLIQLKNKGKLVDDEKLAEEDITAEQNVMTIEEIAGQAFVFFAAGFETASTTITFCLYELARDTSLQDKVRKEIQKVLLKYNGQFTYDAAMDMEYLEQTLHETLRKYPPIPTLHRICTKEYKVPGTDLVLEKGTMVIINTVGVHFDPEYYPNPDKFDPERFSEENKKNRPPFTYIPFGEGPRVCIGNRFGMMQSKVGLVSLLLNYEFTLNKKTIQPMKFDTKSFTAAIKGGLWLDAKKINPNPGKLNN